MRRGERGLALSLVRRGARVPRPTRGRAHCGAAPGHGAGVGIAVSSSGTGILGDGAVDAGLVVATPGAVPAVPGGYAQAIVIDAGALVGPGSTARRTRSGSCSARPRTSGLVT